MKKPRRNRPASVPAQQNNNPQTITRTVVQTTAGWSGPLPPPAALEEFNRIVPGGAERIFAQFEAEGAHRRDLEERQSRFVVRDTHIGQFLAGLFAFMGLGVAALAIYFDQPVTATILGSGTIAPIDMRSCDKHGIATQQANSPSTPLI